MKKESKLLLNVILAAVVGLACLGLLLAKTFRPAIVLPQPTLPLLAALSLAALVIEGYLAPGVKRTWVPLVLLAGVTFALLPWCAGLADAGRLPELFLLGGVTFAVTAFLFTSMTQRLASGPVCRAAPILSAFLLFLASQCLTGILL